MSGDATNFVEAHKALPPPMAFASWLGQNANLLQPPVNNYCLFSGKDMVLMVVGGPNTRNGMIGIGQFPSESPKTPCKTSGRRNTEVS